MAEILYNEIYPKGATTKNIVAKSKDVKYAKAGTTIVYDTFEEYTYGTPVITVEYKTVLSRNGGSIKPTVTYSLTRTKRGYSERAYTSETISGTVESFTASGNVLNNSEATIDTSNGTVSRDSLGTTYKSATWNIMEVTVTATINGVLASGTGIAKMQSNTYTDSGGVTTYSDVVKGSITHGYISASGGEATATATAGSQDWYTSEVVRTFLTKSTKVITPAKSGTDTINGTTLAVSKNSKGTDISKVTVAGTKTVTWTGLGNKSATGTLYVYQNANYVTELTLSGGGLAYDTFTAAGTTKTPKTSTSKTVTFKFTSGSTTTTIPSSTYGSLSRAVSYGMTTATGFTLNSSSTGSITASNNKSTSARSTTAYRYEKATWTPSSSYPDADTINSSQGSNSCTVSLSEGYYSYSSWSVSISASPTSGISAKGGSSTITASASRTYGWNGATSGVGTQSGTIKLSIPSAVSGSSLSGTASGSTLTWSANYSTSARGVNVRATCQENTSVYKEVTITQNGDTKSSTTTEYSVSISANRYTSSSSSCPAAGGSATLTYSGSTRERYDWVSGDVTYSEWVAATPEISGSATGFTRDGTSVTISSLGVGTKNARSVTYTAKVGTASKSVTIYQQANAVTSTAYKFSTFSLSKTSFTAAGGSATLSMVVLRQYTYTSTSKGDWTTITPSSGTLSVSAGTGGSVGSISYGSTSTCTITVAAYTNTSSNRTISISGNYNSGSATASTSITQTKDAISSYGNVTAGSLSYSISGDIPASGGTVTITPSAGSLPVYWVSGRETSQTVSAPSSLSIYGDNLGTSEKSRTSLGTKTFTWAGSGNKTASVTSKTIYQQANTYWLSGVRIVAYLPDSSWLATGSWSSIPAGGHYLGVYGYYCYTWSSGKNTESGAGHLRTGLTFTESMAEAWTNGGIHVLSRGTSYSTSTRSGSVYWTHGSFTSNSLSFTLKKNVITSVSVTSTPGTITGTTFTAANSTKTTTSTGASATAKLTFSSGSSLNTNYNTTTYGTWTFHGYSWLSNATYATLGTCLWNSLTVTMAANKTTSSRSATITRKEAGFTFTLSSSYNDSATSGTSAGTLTTCTVTQDADSITKSIVSYSGLKCTLTNNLTASGGSATVKVTTLKTTTHTWASGKNPTYEYVNNYDVTSSATKTIDHATLFNFSGAVIEASTRFSISGATVSHSSMLNKVGIDKVCVKATFSGLTAYSDYASALNSSWYVYTWKTLYIRATTVGYGALNVILTRSGTLTKTLTYTSGYSDPGTTINVSPSFDSLSIQSGSGCSIYNILLGIIRWSENTGTGLRSVYLQGSVTANNVAKSFSNIIATQRGKEVHNFTLNDNTSDAGAWIDGWNNGSASDISFTDTTGNWFNTLSSIYVVIENTDGNSHTFLLSATGGSVDMTSVTIDAGDLVNVTFTPNSLVFNHVLDIDLYS